MNNVQHPRFTLEQFVTESNRVEGMGAAQPHEIQAHELLLNAPVLTQKVLQQFVFTISGAVLRDRKGLDVRVGNHYPPPGGPEIPVLLEEILRAIVLSRDRRSTRLFYVPHDGISPYDAHVAYETIHPFTDGNGRSGRAVWLWHKGGIREAPLGFLHHFYYETLDASRKHGS